MADVLDKSSVMEAAVASAAPISSSSPVLLKNDLQQHVKEELQQQGPHNSMPPVQQQDMLRQQQETIPQHIIDTKQQQPTTQQQIIDIKQQQQQQQQLNSPPQMEIKVEEVETISEPLQFLNHAHIVLNTPFVENSAEESELDELLEFFNLEEVKPYLTKAKITYESLRYLSKEDIKEAIPPIGLRACFRQKLFSWRKREYSIDDDDTLSDAVASKVVNWLQNQQNISTTSTPTSFTTLPSSSHLSKSLRLILQESLKGKAILNFYEKKFHLTDIFRGDLINIILDDILYNETKLSPKHLPLIVDEIIDIFPSEIKEYYFIPRRFKSNPGGKLWDKYVNQRAKRSRSSVKVVNTVEVPALNSQTNSNTEIADEILESLKATLSREFSNWNEVLDKWKRTFALRQKELKNSKSNYEFLSDWPLYANPKSFELINIDFEILYPNKSELLFSKWNDFIKKIPRYYASHIKDKKSKEIFTNAEGTTNKSSLDYIYTVLLNSVILPTARFSDKSAKQWKKISIPEASESFVIHVSTISDYEKIISNFREKYYNSSLTVQPLIIVVGENIYNLEQFFVYFNKTLLKFDTFLKSLDICFKIMHTLSLEYPKGCQGPWLFIQEYFYEITLDSDKKLSTVCSLYSFLKSN